MAGTGRKAGTGKAAAGGRKRGRKRVPYTLEVAPDVQRDIEEIVEILDLAHVDPMRIVCFRSRGATARIYARIWSLPRIWQMALGVEAHYAIEVVELYDRSSREDQLKTLIHELLHVPKTFSGALVPHKCFGKEINDDACDALYDVYVERIAARAREDLGEREPGPWAIAQPDATPTPTPGPSTTTPALADGPGGTAPLAAATAREPVSARADASGQIRLDAYWE